jgi:hypothetical protein
MNVFRGKPDRFLSNHIIECFLDGALDQFAAIANERLVQVNMAFDESGGYQLAGDVDTPSIGFQRRFDRSDAAILYADVTGTGFLRAGDRRTPQDHIHDNLATLRKAVW